MIESGVEVCDRLARCDRLVETVDVECAGIPVCDGTRSVQVDGGSN